MRIVDASFEVSDSIWCKINSGSYERVGGVVRDAHSKEIVAWLRETGSLKQLSSSLVSVGNACSILSLGVSVIGFGLVLNRLSVIDVHLRNLSSLVTHLEENNRSTALANFDAALKSAQNAIRSQNNKQGNQFAHIAIDRFHEAESYYTNIVDRALSEGSILCENYLNIIFLAYAAGTRCYLELEDLEGALMHLYEGKKKLEPLTDRYVDMLLTDNPAVYLHTQLKNEVDLSRLTEVFSWRSHGTEEISENLVFQKLREKIFAVDQSEWVKKLLPIFWDTSLGVPKKKTSWWTLTTDVYPHLPKALGRTELMIETSRRLDGYVAELEDIKLDKIEFRKWKNISDVVAESSESVKVHYLIPRCSHEYENYELEGVEAVDTANWKRTLR